MATPYTPASFIQMTPSAIPPTPTPPTRGRGAKRGRKPRGAVLSAGTPTHQPTIAPVPAGLGMVGPQFTPVQWATPTIPTAGPSTPVPPLTAASSTTTATVGAQPNGDPSGSGGGADDVTMDSEDEADLTTSTNAPFGVGASTNVANGATTAATATGGTAGDPKPGSGAGDEDGEGEDELLPAMADDDYSAQLSWQSESKDNLKVLMDNFSPAQYDRFEAYRRHALPKQAVRRVIQQTTGQQVSQPVAQVVAGFAKVFVGEIVEKARGVQARRGETGPLSPDHLREAYRLYQAETGRVGSARAGRGRKLFVR